MQDNNPIVIYNELFDKYYKSVVSYFSKRYNSNEAEDLAQITFMRIWQYIPNWQYVKKEKSLIFKIAKNVLLDKQKQQKPLESLDSVKELEYNADFSSVEINQVISKLNAKDREIIALKQAGFSSREIAKIQGVAASTIRTRLQNIRKYLLNNI